ncbi:hypothetical protein HPB50_018111 [Hyalomma asiaticum]|uniref:Uncharacterized protein n=1 Tax=Hyalomma asiaticum TaxID=266040 RepID=A0ACB7RY62_HYAAI|nr:hypothetical protein HPB50_018111 [Hyalomma asiaticum]
MEQSPAGEETTAAAVTKAQAKEAAKKFEKLKEPDPGAEPERTDAYAEEQQADESLRHCFTQQVCSGVERRTPSSSRGSTQLAQLPDTTPCRSTGKPATDWVTPSAKVPRKCRGGEGLSLRPVSRMARTPDVELCLPRLKLDMGMRLESILYYMGLSDLFSERANLSGMFGEGVNMHATEWIHHAVADMVNDPTKPRRYSFCSTGDSTPPDIASRSTEEEISPPPASAMARRRSSTASRASIEDSAEAGRRRGSGSATPPSTTAQPKTSCLKKEGKKGKARVRRSSIVRTTIPFVVNRPFIFYVLHRELSLLLFMGVVKRIS